MQTCDKDTEGRKLDKATVTIYTPHASVQTYTAMLDISMFSTDLTCRCSQKYSKMQQNINTDTDLVPMIECFLYLLICIIDLLLGMVKEIVYSIWKYISHHFWPWQKSGH